MEQSTIAILIITAAVISFALEKIPLAMTAILAGGRIRQFWLPGSRHGRVHDGCGKCGL